MCIFHPKIYLFKTGKKFESIVGSANFTNGGLGRNYEACLHIKGSVDDEIFKQLQRELSSYDSIRQCVTPIIATSYRYQFNAESKRNNKKNPILPKDKEQWKRIDSFLAMMPWNEFSKLIKNDPHHHFEGRMELLRKFQSLFAGVEEFSHLSVSAWKGIAGTLRTEADAQEMGNYNWEIGRAHV